MTRSVRLIGGPGDGDEFPVHSGHLFPETIHVPGFTGKDETYHRWMIYFSDDRESATYVHQSFRGFKGCTTMG